MFVIYLTVYAAILVFLMILYWLSKTQKTKESLKKFFLLCAILIGLWGSHTYYQGYMKETLISESTSPAQDTSLKVVQVGQPGWWYGIRLRVISPQNQLTVQAEYQNVSYFPSDDIVITWQADDKATIEVFEENRSDPLYSILEAKPIRTRTFHYERGKGVSY